MVINAPIEGAWRLNKKQAPQRGSTLGNEDLSRRGAWITEPPKSVTFGIALMLPNISNPFYFAADIIDNFRENVKTKMSKKSKKI